VTYRRGRSAHRSLPCCQTCPSARSAKEFSASKRLIHVPDILFEMHPPLVRCGGGAPCEQTQRLLFRRAVRFAEARVRSSRSVQRKPWITFLRIVVWSKAYETSCISLSWGYRIPGRRVRLENLLSVQRNQLLECDAVHVGPSDGNRFCWHRKSRKQCKLLTMLRLAESRLAILQVYIAFAQWWTHLPGKATGPDCPTEAVVRHS
jgi:hypothetical protein